MICDVHRQNLGYKPWNYTTAGQRKETKGDQMSALEKVLTNRVSISEINAIRHLLKGFSIHPIVNNDVKLVTVQRIFSGLLEGVIPITSPQSLYFTKAQRGFMEKLATMELYDAKDYIEENTKMFFNIFKVLDMSLKLMVRAYVNFDGEVQANDDDDDDDDDDDGDNDADDEDDDL